MVLKVVLISFLLTVSQITECRHEKVIISTAKNIKVGSVGLLPRVFGGNEARDGQFPFMVFLMYRASAGLGSCSSSLVSPDYVLAACHCFFGESNPNPQNVIMVAGKANVATYVIQRQSDWNKPIDEASLGVQERRGAQVFLSPNYNKLTFFNDVALVRSDKPFVMSNTVQPIAISQGTLRSRTSCTILGWGYAEKNIRTYGLLYADNAIAKSVLEGCDYKKDGPFLCLEKGRSGICQGDSGSPLVCGDLVHGVASHVLSEVKDPTCGDDLNEIYSELYPELMWLNNFLNVQNPVSPTEDVKAIEDNGAAAKQLYSFLALFSIIVLIYC